jgi:TonB family protein
MKILVVVLVLVASMGAFFYRSYTHSPEYALVQAGEAIREHDIAGFDRYVDLDTAIPAAIDALLDLRLSPDKNTGLGETLAAGLVKLAAPNLAIIAKREVHTAIEKGDLRIEERNLGLLDRQIQDAARGLFSNFTEHISHAPSIWDWLSGHSDPSIRVFSTQGKICFLRLTVQDAPALDFKLRDTGDHWQIIELANSRELIEKITPRAGTQKPPAVTRADPKASPFDSSTPPIEPSQPVPSRVDPPSIDPRRIEAPAPGKPDTDLDPVIHPPALLSKVEPAYTESARNARLQGTVELSLDVDPHGNATNLRVTHSLGMGLDEEAIEAVKRWRFRPAMKNGQPITMPAQVEVRFRLL